MFVDTYPGAFQTQIGILEAQVSEMTKALSDTKGQLTASQQTNAVIDVRLKHLEDDRIAIGAAVDTMQKNFKAVETAILNSDTDREFWFHLYGMGTLILVGFGTYFAGKHYVHSKNGSSKVILVPRPASNVVETKRVIASVPVLKADKAIDGRES